MDFDLNLFFTIASAGGNSTKDPLLGAFFGALFTILISLLKDYIERTQKRNQIRSVWKKDKKQAILILNDWIRDYRSVINAVSDHNGMLPKVKNYYFFSLGILDLESKLELATVIGPDLNVAKNLSEKLLLLRDHSPNSVWNDFVNKDYEVRSKEGFDAFSTEHNKAAKRKCLQMIEIVEGLVQSLEEKD